MYLLDLRQKFLSLARSSIRETLATEIRSTAPLAAAGLGVINVCAFVGSQRTPLPQKGAARGLWRRGCEVGVYATGSSVARARLRLGNKALC